MVENNDNKDTGGNHRTLKPPRKKRPYKHGTLIRSKYLKQLNVELQVDCLFPYENHPFKLYEGDKLNDMVESIKAHGVLSPIIVRPLSENKYEILSGHNRVKAAKEIGLEWVPAIVIHKITDDEAKLIVTESNLIQRDFSGMLYSERAAVFSMHYEAMKKKPGYRSDLITEIEDMTCSPVANRSRTMNKLGEMNNLSKDTIARYLRINELNGALQEKLDDGRIAIRTAVSLSYLRMEEQEVVAQLLQFDNKIDMEQAKKLRDESSKGELSREVIEQILSQSPIKAKQIKLSKELFSQYFNEGQTAEEIESVIAKALELYSRKNK